MWQKISTLHNLGHGLKTCNRMKCRWPFSFPYLNVTKLMKMLHIQILILTLFKGWKIKLETIADGMERVTSSQVYKMSIHTCKCLISVLFSSQFILLSTRNVLWTMYKSSISIWACLGTNFAYLVLVVSCVKDCMKFANLLN